MPSHGTCEYSCVAPALQSLDFGNFQARTSNSQALGRHGVGRMGASGKHINGEGRKKDEVQGWNTKYIKILIISDLAKNQDNDELLTASTGQNQLDGFSNLPRQGPRVSFSNSTPRLGVESETLLSRLPGCSKRNFINSTEFKNFNKLFNSDNLHNFKCKNSLLPGLRTIAAVRPNLRKECVSKD